MELDRRMKAGECVLSIHADTSALRALLLELDVDLHAADLPLQVAQALFDCLDCAGEFVRLDVDCRAASAAGELRVVFEATDCFLELVAALRAGEFERVLVERGHRGLLS